MQDLPFKRSVLAWGGPDNTNVAAAASSGELSVDIREEGIAGRFVLSSVLDGFLTKLRHRNKPLITGNVPAQLFWADSVNNPRVKRYFTIGDDCIWQITNGGAAGADVHGAWTAVPFAGEIDYFDGDLLRQGMRNLICWGQVATPTDIAAAATQELVFSIAEGGIAGRFVIGAATRPMIDNLIVSSIKVNNDELIVGDAVPASMFAADSHDNPALGIQLRANNDVRMIVTNRGANASETLCAALTCA